ncbi:scamp family-domain-containing protein [Melampsora americana]|nr:scamp family-domain-containing protein [Melampsora americana]
MAAHRQDNPFQDPPQHGLDANPFSDPTVQGALGSHAGYEETAYQVDSASEFHNVDTNSLGESTAASARNDDTAARLAEIKRKEAELEQRERSLGQREEHVKNYGKNNWPPFYPVFFHDIDVEVPAELRTDVRTIYRGWLLLVLVLGWNMITSIFLLTSGASAGGADLGSGIFYFPVITVLSFLLWYRWVQRGPFDLHFSQKPYHLHFTHPKLSFLDRPVYNAYAKEHSLFYLVYFIFGGFHVAFCFYMLIGIPGTGSAGLINMIAAFGRGSILTGVFAIIATVGWALLSLGNAWMWRAVWKHWHDKGHTFNQAKEEVATSGLKAYFGRGNNCFLLLSKSFISNITGPSHPNLAMTTYPHLPLSLKDFEENDKE